MLAAVSLVFALSSELSGMRLLHFVDNQGALANLIAGSAAAMDIAGAIAAYNLIAVKHGIMPWLEYVESDLNVSDGPSRELENLTLSKTAAKLGITLMERAKLPDFESFFASPAETLITLMERAKLPDFESFFASPAETLEHLFDKVRDLTG